MKYLLILAIFIVSCSQKETLTISLTALRDSCYLLKNSADQKIEIIENSFQDTAVLGYAVLYPGYKGRFNYNVFFSGNTEVSARKPTGSFCISLYQKRKTQGKITIKYSVSK